MTRAVPGMERRPPLAEHGRSAADRGRRTSAAAPRRQAPTENLRAILQRTLRESGMARRLPRRIGAHTWAAAVGEQIAARAQPTALFGGTLHVLVQDHRWRDQLDAARNFLIERLNRALGAGTVRELQFGLAHTGALDVARKAAGLGTCEEPTPAIEPARVLGHSRLEGTLREALLRAAEASARRAARE